MKISPSRLAAFDVLLRIETERAFSSVLLPVAEDELSAADRSLCHELVLGTLRIQLYLDRMISTLTGSRRLDPPVRIALRLAIYQLNFLDRIPPHSAVNDSVNLVHRARKGSAKAFVNAVLRQMLREPPLIRFSDEMDQLSVDYSHPPWLLEKWIGDFGKSAALAIAEANNRLPEVAFRPLSDDPLLIDQIRGFARRSEYVPDCYMVNGRAGGLMKLVTDGKVYLQDEGSQLVASSVLVSTSEVILDVCAAPGGKTGMIARQAARRSAALIAGDVTSSRVRLLRDSIARQGVTVRGILQYDAAVTLPFRPGSFDTVLVDAPCSGTGTIRHNPELRYFVEPGDFSRFADKQLAILISASETVRPGGQLIYSTCSLEKEENEVVCQRFLKTEPFESIVPSVPEKFLTSGGHARTMPGRDEMDGFFIAAFKRK